MSENGGLIWIFAAWAGYGAIHSLLAAPAVREALIRRWPALRPAYRLLYNALAVVLLAPPLLLTYLTPGEPLLVWEGPWRLVALLMALAGVAGFVWSLKYYDMEEFLGLRQWRQRHAEEAEERPELVISPLHRWVRHPWYSCALLLIWSRDMNTPMVASAVAMSLYFAIGAWFEERKLLRLHGRAYAEYRRRVPAFLPRPWRWLSPGESPIRSDAPPPS